MNNKIKDFTDLNAWRESHRLVLDVYKITENFPKKEMFGLISQMRRAAISVTSNIAEGFGRQGYKEKIQFYYLAQGSLIELKNQIIITHIFIFTILKCFFKLITKGFLNYISVKQSCGQ